MKEYKEKLIAYAEGVLERGNGSKERMLGWIFGAIHFAYFAGLIDHRTSDELWEKYRNFD